MTSLSEYCKLFVTKQKQKQCHYTAVSCPTSLKCIVRICMYVLILIPNLSDNEFETQISTGYKQHLSAAYKELD